MSFTLKSMRGRLTLITVAIVGVVFLLFSMLLIFSSYTIVRNSIRSALESQVDDVALLIEKNQLPSSLTGIGGDKLIQVVDDKGNLLAASSWAQDLPSLKGRFIPSNETDGQDLDDLEWDDDHDDDDDADDDDHDDDDDDVRESSRESAGRASGSSVPVSPTPQQRSTIATITPSSTQGVLTGEDALGSKGPYWTYRRGVSGPAGPLTIVGVTSLEHAVQTAQSVAFVLAVAIPVALALAAVLSNKLAKATMRPVDDLRQRAEQISITDLNERLPVPQNDEDIARLTSTFNEMLARLATSIKDQQQFVSDASHELKSPVAATRIMLEVAMLDPAKADLATLLPDLLEENERLEQIIQDLLFLARSDEGLWAAEKSPVDFAEIVYSEADDLLSRVSVVCDTSGVEPVTLEADASGMHHVLRNLLDNAARYCASKVWIRCHQDEDEVVVHISDDGPGIPKAHREAIFERFVRLDDDRGRDSGSTGLGLAVVRAIVEQHGGSVRVVSPLHKGATLEVRLPANNY